MERRKGRGRGRVGQSRAGQEGGEDGAGQGRAGRRV